MSEKLVHVNSYKRGDGTLVKEHYRGGVSSGLTEGDCGPEESNSGGIADGTCMGDILEVFGPRGNGLMDLIRNLFKDPRTMSQSMSGATPILTGGVSKDVFFPSGILESLGAAGEAVQVVLALGAMASGLALEGIKLASAIKYAIKNFDSLGASQFGAEMNGVLGSIRDAHALSVNAERALLEKLSSTSDQREYKTLYDTYVNQRELNRASKALVDRISYAHEHGNYDEVETGLREYSNLHTERARGIEERVLINSQPITMNFAEQTLPETYPSISENIGNLVSNTVVPNIERIGIGAVMNCVGTLKGKDANMLWKVATDDVKGYKDYVEQNGVFVDSISDLPFDFKDTVRAKVKQQLGVDDLRGLILYPDSTLAQDIISSSEYQNFIRKSMNKLQRGEVVSGSVGYTMTRKTLNLGAALGRADILDTYINKNGDIISFVLDTYDFNKGESWPIEVARDVQEHGLLNGFYSITILLVPKEQWLSWMVN